MTRISIAIAGFTVLASLMTACTASRARGPVEASRVDATAAAHTLERFTYRRVCLGCDARIAVYAPDEESAREGARAAFARIDAIDAIASDYRVDSEVARLEDGAGGESVAVSAELVRMLSLAIELARHTDGAYDVTAAPVTRLWREAIRAGRVPDPAALAAARRRVDWRAIELDEAARTVRLARRGMQLDLGSIAKGFAADEAMRALRERGLAHALVDLAGDIVVGAPPPDRAAWHVGVAGRDLAFELVDAAIATSGDSVQGVDTPGGRRSHLVDPRSGEALVDRGPVTVIAPTGMLADALASAISLVDAEAARVLVARYPGARLVR